MARNAAQAADVAGGRRSLDEAAVRRAARAELARCHIDVLAGRAPPVAPVQARRHMRLRIRGELAHAVGEGAARAIRAAAHARTDGGV
eukprot:scaffold84095_cov48-Phaeocystis_antarctica.AAC.1